jgi:hypothetical protein
MDQLFTRGLRGRDRMVVGFTTTCAISAYHHRATMTYYRVCDKSIMTSTTSRDNISLNNSNIIFLDRCFGV